VFVAQEIASYCEHRAERLDGHMPSGAGNLPRRISLCGKRYSRWGELTPRTMPVGNTSPHANI
jgi:hypothetical protein